VSVLLQRPRTCSAVRWPRSPYSCGFTLYRRPVTHPAASRPRLACCCYRALGSAWSRPPRAVQTIARSNSLIPAFITLPACAPVLNRTFGHSGQYAAYYVRQQPPDPSIRDPVRAGYPSGARDRRLSSQGRTLAHRPRPQGNEQGSPTPPNGVPRQLRPSPLCGSRRPGQGTPRTTGGSGQGQPLVLARAAMPESRLGRRRSVTPTAALSGAAAGDLVVSVREA